MDETRCGYNQGGSFEVLTASFALHGSFEEGFAQRALGTLNVQVRNEHLRE
jgi:hypothetical protein